MLSEKILARLKAAASVAAAAVVAIAIVVGAAQVARAESLAPEQGYYQNPIDDNITGAGFEWVSARESGNNRGTGYYRIYDPTNGEGGFDAAHGWWLFATASREYTFDGYLVVLDGCIDFADIDWNVVSNDSNAYTVGGEDMPFSGTFDGGGHTLSNFMNERDGLQLQMDNGFFGWVNQATIKNVNFEDCYVGSTYRGGLVASYAKDSFFLDILAESCTTSVVPANNVLNLVTNAGISGGTIAGVANGCTLYDCEMRAGRVVTNSTAGVAALGGQPLYMGGLVGFANDTTIEYSRVTDIMNDDGTRQYAEVRGVYETAVSVANYSEVFVGGIVGGIQREDTGTKIVDCYSTADVYGKAAIYFGVGLGLGITRAYCGGIVGIAWADGNGENVIERTSYAGNLHSYQYNQLLLGIPIIEEDAYMGGILSVGADNVTVRDAYFDRSASKTDKEIKAYQYWTTDTDGPTNGGDFGPRDDDYTDRNFWESCDFDFAAGTPRNLGYPFTPDASESEWSTDHYNKWAMDYTRGIPVHAGSVKAAMDFPGSGTVTISETSLSNNLEIGDKGWQTTNPYDFAVQGYTEGAELDGNDHDGVAGDAEITVRYDFVTDKNDSWDADDTNQGFRFMGWYSSRDVRVNDIAEDHGLFTTPNATLNTDGEGLLSEKYLWQKNEGGNKPESLKVTPSPTGADPKTGNYADNDLYVAYAQAQVLLHDVSGNVINTYGSAEDAPNLEDDWYDYEATISLPESVAADGVHTGNFIGWTNKANVADGGTDAGYAAIGSTELTALKQNGQLWAPGDTFTVTEPTNLYPVYSQYENIGVIYEGHDSNTLQTRSGYGTADRKVDEAGDLILSVQPTEGSPLADGTVRFLGWYEYVGDETTAEAADADTNPKSWLRVSRGTQDGDVAANADCYTFNVSESGADLTDQHIYKARFEYRVDYRYYNVGLGAWDYYAQVWERYGDQFESISGPSYRAFYFRHWAAPTNEETRFDVTYCEDDSHAYSNSNITEPIVVVAHHTDDGSNDNIVVSTDFPTGPAVSINYETLKPLYPRFGIEDDNLNASDSSEKEYWFHGWVYDSTNGEEEWRGASTDAYYQWNHRYTDTSTGETYWVEAHVTGRVQFHAVPGAGTSVVERRYNDPVLFAPDSEYAHAYNKPYHFEANAGEAQTVVGSTTAASPTNGSMARQGYIFLGWLDMSDADVKNAEGLITNGTIEGTDAYLAKTPALVAPYLLTGEEVCTRPMDLYPVYTQFEVNTTTNVAEAKVDTSIYNVPSDPSLIDGPIQSTEGTVQVTFNEHAEDTVSGTNTVGVSYDKAYNAEVKVTVDTDAQVWKSPEEGVENELYEFLSLSVYKDSELVQTVPASEFSKDANGGSMTSSEAILIAAGYSYEFVANYSPVPVTVSYHLSNSGDGATEVHSAKVGDVLPLPEGTPSFAGYKDQFVVGWVEGDQTGSVNEWPVDEGTAMLVPGTDKVTGTMHLWPVYRLGDVKVKSNIDTDEGPNDFRRAVKRPGDEENLWLEADEVPGYTFTGWTTTAKNEESVSVSSSNQHPLTGDSRFDGATYTANYEKAQLIRYHDTDGNVIYTVSIKDGDEDRIFVQKTQVQVPIRDENGDLQYDEDGNILTKLEEQIVPIDQDAFIQISKILDAKNADPNATRHEQFVTWQWIDTPDGTGPQRWNVADANNFVNQSASENMGDDGVMDLYPITVTLSATDTSSQPYTNLEAQLTLNEEGTKIASASVTLLGNYSQAWLKAHIDEVLYAPNADGSVEQTPVPQTGVPVSLYTSNSDMDSPVATATTTSEETTDGATGEELQPGDAIFSFAGRITITKQTADAKAAGQTFSFTVTNSEGESRVVNVTLDNNPQNGVYVGTTTVNVPFGSYTVAEDAGWAWRYDDTTEKWDGADGVWEDGGEVTVQFEGIFTANNPDGVTSAVRVSNTRYNNNWLDGNAYAHNTFGPTTVEDGGAQNGGEE